MTDTLIPTFRIDSFTVPASARAAFLARVNATHAVLKQQAGFQFDRIVERKLSDEASRIITIVEWESEEAIAGAVAAVKAAHAADGFSTPDFIRNNSIVADLGFYKPVAA